MAQTATTGNLENAQRIIIASARYTEEHNAPALALIEQFSLPKGMNGNCKRLGICRSRPEIRPGGM